MSTYKELFGKYVRSVGSDPSAAAGLGEIWYNTSSNTFKSSVGIGAWSSGGSVNTIRSALSGAGTQNDMIINGGTSPASPGSNTATETYNGTCWAAITASPTATNQNASTGTVTTAANFIGGGPDPKKNITQHWDGSGWSAGGTLATARANMKGTGPDAAGIILGGQGAAGAGLLAEKYNGTSWSSAGTLAGANFGGSMAGTSTAALGFGGYYDLRPSGGSEAQTANTFSYDGSTWTIVNSMSNVRNYAQGAGSQGSAIVGGTNSAPNSTLAEQWDGTSWTAAAVMGIGRWSGASAGTSGAAATVVAGLSGGSYVGTSEEYSMVSTVKTLTTS